MDEKSAYDAAMVMVLAYLFFLAYLPRIRVKDACSPADE